VIIFRLHEPSDLVAVRHALIRIGQGAQSDTSAHALLTRVFRLPQIVLQQRLTRSRVQIGADGRVRALEALPFGLRRVLAALVVTKFISAPLTTRSHRASKYRVGFDARRRAFPVSSCCAGSRPREAADTHRLRGRRRQRRAPRKAASSLHRRTRWALAAGKATARCGVEGREVAASGRHGRRWLQEYGTGGAGVPETDARTRRRGRAARAPIRCLR
jgi:hypothetical protein